MLEQRLAPPIEGAQRRQLGCRERQLLANVREHGAWHVIERIEHRASHANEPELNRGAEPGAGAESSAQDLSVGRSQRKESSHLKCAELVREPTPSQIRPQQRAHRRLSRSGLASVRPTASRSKRSRAAAVQRRNRYSSHEKYATPCQATRPI
jgi:hypothetical protein